VARLAVLASGNGSNFQALADSIREDREGKPVRGGHECVLLIHDRKAAFAAQRAARLGIPFRHISYFERAGGEAEAEMAAALDEVRADIIALAGFMRILSPSFVEARHGRIANVHPSLLPKWPGARAIERAFEAGDLEFGVTVHLVDAGMDSGPIISRASFKSESGSALADIESRIHEIEHEIYPKAVLGLLDAIDEERRRT
jgi:phosphoribosylglycinamide formyltransferase-1